MALQSFTEYEAYAQEVQGASMAMRNSTLEESTWSLQRAMVGSIFLQHGSEGGGTIAEGATANEAWSLFHQARPIQINGKLVTENEVFVVPPGAEFCLASHRSHDWFTVFIPSPLLFPSAEELEFASCIKPQSLKPPPHVVRSFVSLVHRALQAADHFPQLLDSPVALETLQGELLSSAQGLFSNWQDAASRRFVHWHRQTRMALDIALKGSEQTLSIVHLAERIGVPERTLRTSFQKCYGLSPIKYLRIQRLHQSRQLLLRSCPDQTSVTRIALGLGFWELGRFAGAYRQLFGELPSQTLRRPTQDSKDQ